MNLPAINAYSKQLQAGGVYTAVGPIGPLGPYGPLGPLGPRGPYGSFLNPIDGKYYKDGQVLTKVTGAVPWSATERRLYSLVEQYPNGTAPATGLDTSFVAVDWTRLNTTKSYEVTSDQSQFVTVVVVPNDGFKTLSGMLSGPLPATAHPFNASAVNYEEVLVFGRNLPTAEQIADRYSLSISDSTGCEIAVSDVPTFANWIQIRMPKAGSMTVNVTLKSVWETDPVPVTSGYGLIVTGSTDWINATDIRGAHLRTGS